MTSPLRMVLLAALACAPVQPAFAHVMGGAAGGFGAGFVHPLAGWDHVVAMVAVGLWAASLGRPAIWTLPLVFPLVMMLGGALALAGVAVPSAETAIGASVLVLGLLVAFAARPPSWVAAGVVAVFAVFHGQAHGAELPAATGVAAYAAGFVAATLLLHLAGIALGLLTRRPAGMAAVRAGGAAIALAGAAFLAGLA